MRSWAEERRTGTDELLLSLPLGETALVAAKYTALLILLAMMLALTLPLPLTLLPLGDFEIGGIIGQYIGLLLLMSSAAAIGLLLSIASGSQTAAFLLSAAVLLLLMLLPAAAVRAGVPLPVIEALRSISLWSRFQSFAKGVVDTRDVCYYLLLSAGATLAGGHILVLRSWR
jgi:ABC-2 type transport system permease protein